MSAQYLAQEKIWFNKSECDDAELRLHGKVSTSAAASSSAKNADSSSDVDLFASDDEPVAEKPKMVKPSVPKPPPAANKKTSKKSAPVDKVDGIAAMAGRTNPDLVNKINALELENKNLKKVTDDLKNLVLKLENRVASLENGGKAVSSAPAAKEEDDDDVDLFGSGSDDEEEDAEKARIREERLKAYHEKKSKKPALIAKTSVLLDVKPWDDETDMDAMLKACKTIQKEGLVWGASKLVPVGYGIQKLQVMCVVEDEKVSIDELCEQITEFEDYVQSVDVASMSKI